MVDLDIDKVIKAQIGGILENPQNAMGMAGGAAPMLLGMIMNLKKRKTPPRITDVAGQIRELAALRDEGNITAEEFEVSKKILLASLKSLQKQK